MIWVCSHISGFWSRTENTGAVWDRGDGNSNTKVIIRGNCTLMTARVQSGTNNDSIIGGQLRGEGAKKLSRHRTVLTTSRCLTPNQTRFSENVFWGKVLFPEVMSSIASRNELSCPYFHNSYVLRVFFYSSSERKTWLKAQTKIIILLFGPKRDEVTGDWG